MKIIRLLIPIKRRTHRRRISEPNSHAVQTEITDELFVFGFRAWVCTYYETRTISVCRGSWSEHVFESDTPDQHGHRVAINPIEITDVLDKVLPIQPMPVDEKIL